MSRPFPRKCATCREKAVQPIVLPSYSLMMDHDGRSYPITLKQVPGTRCEHCGVLILAESVSDRADSALRVAVGLLEPAEIKSLRQALKLTQKVVAQALRIGEATLSRWQTGAQMQQRSMDLLLRLFFEFPEVRRFLGVNEELSQPKSFRPTTAQANVSVETLHGPDRWEQSQPTFPGAHSVRSGLSWANVDQKSLINNFPKDGGFIPNLSKPSQLKLRMVG